MGALCGALRLGFARLVLVFGDVLRRGGRCYREWRGL